MRANLRLIQRLYGDSKSLLAVGSLSAVGQSALLVPIALLVRRIFDQSIPEHRRDEIVLIGLAIFMLYLGSALLGLISRRLIVRITKESVGRLRVELLAHLYSLPREWHDSQSAGELHAIVVQDSERLDLIIGQLARSVVPALIIAAALTIVALIVNPLLFAILLAAVPGLIFAGRRLARSTRRLARAWLEALKTFSAQTQLALRALTLTKVHGAESWELERRSRQIEQVTRASRQLDSAQASHSVFQSALGAAAGSGLLVIGGIAVTRHEITLGGLLAFYAVAILLLRQFALIGPGLANVTIGSESLVRLERLLATDAREPYHGTLSLNFHGAVEVEQVSFGYREQPVVEEISLSVAAGEHVALVGPNGSGKSTLVSLLLGLYRPQAGRLLFDDVPIAELDVHALRRQVGVLLQDPVLFPGSISQNIAYGCTNVRPETVSAAAEAAVAAEFIDALPDGFETQIGDEGVLLSGGQRQRIALARALMGRPALLVLDEPTTHLDKPTIDKVLDRVADLAHAPTVIVVTHDPDVALRVDRIVHMRDGRIVKIEPGSRLRLGPARSGIRIGAGG